MRDCPHCGNWASEASPRCLFCGRALPAAAAASAPRAPFDEAAWARDNLSTEGRRMLHLRRADGLSEEHIARLLQLAPGFVAESLRGIEERIAQARKEA